MSTDLLLNTLLLGIGATIIMDLVALVQKHILKQQVLDYAMVGRWIGHMPKGRFIHSPIMKSQPIAFEAPIGWAVHYLIGILFAYVFLLIMGDLWLQSPILWPALGFGIATVIAPYFIMQPCLGAGIAASKTPAPNIARLKSLFAHSTSGIGLWLTALLLNLA
jgi:hypothetical protein